MPYIQRLESHNNQKPIKLNFISYKAYTYLESLETHKFKYEWYIRWYYPLLIF